MAQKLREKSPVPRKGWSNWVRAMVPAENPDPDDMVARYYESRGDGQTGVICRNIRTTLPEEMAQCGIYEWKAVPGDNLVVYVGSTCRAKPGSLRARVLEYCTSGSHKKDLINEALKRGYELHVRVKTCGNGSRAARAAEDMENELLKTYNYAWNVRNNAIRDIL